MVSLWKPALIKSIYMPGKFLINGRFLVTNNRLTNSDKNDNDGCKQSSSATWKLPPPPCCTPPIQPVCCPNEPPECCPTPPQSSCPPHHEQGTSYKPIEHAKKQYTLMTDLAKKGYEIIQLIGNSNEYDFAKEQIKKAISLSYAYAKQYGTLLKKNVSNELNKVRAKKAAKVDPKKPPK